MVQMLLSSLNMFEKMNVAGIVCAFLVRKKCKKKKKSLKIEISKRSLFLSTTSLFVRKRRWRRGRFMLPPMLTSCMK